MNARDEQKVIDPLVFWPLHKDKFPILYRIAAQVLAQDATSGTPERTNSLAGIYISPRRNRLSPKTVEKMVSLHGHYMEKEPISKRRAVAKDRFERFITQQSIDCQNKDDGTTFLNSLCAWIYGDDSEDEDELEEDDEEEQT